MMKFNISKRVNYFSDSIEIPIQIVSVTYTINKYVNVSQFTNVINVPEIGIIYMVDFIFCFNEMSHVFMTDKSKKISTLSEIYEDMISYKNTGFECWKEDKIISFCEPEWFKNYTD